MTDLSLIPFDDLMEEIGKRFDHAIFVGIVDKEENIINMKRKFFGSRLICLAACDTMKDVIKDDFYETYKPDEEDTDSGSGKSGDKFT